MKLNPIYIAGVQKYINQEVKQSLTADGQWGPKSSAALKILQTKLKIPVTGVIDDVTQSVLNVPVAAKYLTFELFEAAAARLKTTVVHVRTVCEVEARGVGFLNDGRAKILFERHHFFASIKQKFGLAKANELFAKNPDICNPVAADKYKGNEYEYMRLAEAIKIDEWSAYYATSFGLFQIMGFNYMYMGYKDPIEYGKAAQISEAVQLEQFCTFLEKYKNGKCLVALRACDWPTLALNYNGSNYAKWKYDINLDAAFKKFTKNIYA